MTKPEDELRRRIERQAQRMEKAQRDQPTLLAQTAFVGTLGLLLAVPVVAGAYLGLWLDHMIEGYSIHWTLGMITLGVLV
ncbi:MAG: synthase protein, partial [Proteobacteria bacterium]|nr:synthase protein [Pseudomonadota bacterium]